MTESLHCNNCLKIGFDGTVKYYLTECEKVFCNKCLQTNTKSCVKCLPNKCRVIELNHKTKPDIQLFFNDITSSFQKLHKIEVFQKSQRNHLTQKLLAENKRLVDECNQQKQMNQNLENELKIIKTEMADKRQTNAFNNLFNDSNESQMNVNKSIFKDLFKTESQKPNVFNSNENRIQTNLTEDPMSPLMSMSIDSNLNRSSTNQLIPTTRSPLSPLQSIRKSKISLRSTHPSTVSRNSMSSSSQNQLIDFQLRPMKPMTYTLNKNNFPQSVLSSGSERTPIQRRYPRVSPTNSSPSVLSLLTRNRNSYLRH